MTLLAAAVLLFNGFFDLLVFSLCAKLPSTCAKTAASEIIFRELEFASPSRSFPLRFFEVPYWFLTSDMSFSRWTSRISRRPLNSCVVLVACYGNDPRRRSPVGPSSMLQGKNTKREKL